MAHRRREQLRCGRRPHRVRRARRRRGRPRAARAPPADALDPAARPSGCACLAAHFDDAELRALSAEIDASAASPLDYYPLTRAGERFPVADPELAPRLSPRPDADAEFLHGMLEGMARIEAMAYAKLQELGTGRPPGPHPRRR